MFVSAGGILYAAIWLKPIVEKETGDGTALVFFNSAEAPVEISKASQSYLQVQLRMGFQ